MKFFFKVTDEEFKENASKYTVNPPLSKEAYYYRRNFEANYKNCDHFTPHMWLPRWCGDVIDPSARTLNIYQQQRPEDK